MLTEVDIKRIMHAQRRLAESIAEEIQEEEMQQLLDDDELFEMLDVDLPISETNGLM